jgi:chemotaxis protein MotB
MKNYILLLIVSFMISSCVSSKKYSEMENKSLQQQESLQKKDATIMALRSDLRDQENKLLITSTDLSNEKYKVKSLEQQLEYFKSTNTNLLDRLSDLSIVSKSGAESIKKSLEALNEQNRYIKDLTTSMQRKDSINLILVMNLKRALSNFDDEDITIEVKKGVVYVSISDKMLFKSGSYLISSRAEEVLGKIAKVVNDHNQLDIMVEGHTDNVPISTTCMLDNWDLSVKRATAVVRLLQTKYSVDPTRLTAGGRSEYIPKTSNESDDGKALNRRTEIIILPELDQFFQLLEPPSASVDSR